MAPDRYYAAFVDATTEDSVISCPTARSPSQVRRSFSIFSRKGSEAPEPSPLLIAQEVMWQPKLMSERQKSWVSRRMSVRSTSPKTPKSAATSKTPNGTILNAVPQAKTISMTPLEEEMATSPNDEVLSAIGDHASTLTALTVFQPSSQIQQDVPKSKSSTSSSYRSTSRKRRENASRIGTWVNGVVHWDEGVLDTKHQEEGIEETGFTCVRPASYRHQQDHRLVRKPNLSVMIPPGEAAVNDPTVSTISRLHPRRPMKSMAPASIVSKFARPTPAIVLNEADTFSPVESGQTPEMVLQEQPGVPIYPHRGHVPNKHSRSSTSSSSANTDDASYCSRRSSATSVEALGLSCTSEQLEKELPPLPPPRPSPSVMRPAIKKNRASKSLKLNTNTSLSQASPIKHSRSVTELDRCDRDFIRTAPNVCGGNLCVVHHRDIHCASPTLSQAEAELHNELSRSTPERDEGSEVESRFDSAIQSQAGSLKRTGSVREVMQPPVRAPTIPKRSRKRDWKDPRQTRKIATLPSPPLPMRRRSETEAKLPEEQSATTPTLRKSASTSLSVFGKSADPSKLSLKEPTSHKSVSYAAPVPPPNDDTAKEAVEQQDATEEDANAEYDSVATPISEVPSNSAENVLLNILASLSSLDDLFDTAIINKGMYRVYKENEMDLIRTVAHNESAAAWEFREWCPPERNIHGTDSSKASSQLEHTPLSYMRCHRRDLGVIESLKGLILQRCQTFIRRETIFALSTPSHPNAGRFNDAFWRIGSFCQIFGSQKGREDDITGQIDWLKGGLLANNQGCVATVNTNLDFDMGSVLLNPPDHFARSNAGGLYATQLYDMTELWTCMMVLLHGYSGRVEQARLFGIFADCTDLVEGDIEKENLVLEEWLAYLMTLGPAVVLEMAAWADQPYPAGFELAKENGWTTWTPPIYTGSRVNFLKEPVAKTYEEQVAFAKLRMQDPIAMEQKERSRQRVASLAAEIRLRRQSSEYKRLPLIDMNSERPMSMYSRRSVHVAANHSRHSSSSKHLPPIPPAPISQNAASLWASPVRKISPIVEQQMSLRGIAANTSEAAVARIVELGFTEGQAKNALRMTDMGDGIRLDRAVELLIRRVT
ncbi:hypothetical protein DOTSEDRAFT_68835 [Dothistroma septosporum NZE10]|uniref:UBA domain-containing protein n=1 Tax=Dothistroma septosporum (strain NZE10 / CBS 128990) TaxID=675120 RepID=N1Q2W7_DOTSN|nr:hypothetical protein DOTSEDRAFT_68835 [Dothistroma septosporum NZE10]